MVFESKLKINEELSVADNVIKVTNMIIDKSIAILPKIELEASDEKYRFFKETDFDINVSNLIPNTDVLHIHLFVYCFDSIENYNCHKYYLNTNCSADFEKSKIDLRLVTINGEPNEEFNSFIQHEVNHIYQYANGASKNETLYDKIVKVSKNKSSSIEDRYIAFALYLTFTTEQDSFTNQYFAYLKQNKVPFHKIFDYFPEDDGNPYNQFLDVYEKIDKMNIDDEHLNKLFGINKKQLFLKLNNADKRIRNKLMKAAMRYEKHLQNEEQLHSNEIIWCHDMRNLNFLMDCIHRGIQHISSEFETL